MIEIRLTIEEISNKMTGATFSWNDLSATEGELSYLETLLPSLKHNNNEVACIAERLLRHHAQSKSS